MDEELDIVSSGPRWGHGARWPGPGRSGWIAILLLGGVLACLGLAISLALQVAHRNDTINKLHAAVRNASQSAPATAAQPTIENTVAYTLPDTADGSYSVVAVGIRPKPDSAVLTWLFVYARHASRASATVCAKPLAETSTSPGQTWQTGPRTRTATSRSWRPTSPASPRKVPGSRCTGGRTARRWAAYRVRRSAGVPQRFGTHQPANRAAPWLRASGRRWRPWRRTATSSAVPSPDGQNGLVRMATGRIICHRTEVDLICR